ncbi:MAG: GAF domain-containing protein [Candidatus Rokuibacteriota bacterium]
MPDTVNLDARLDLLLRLVESITASPDLDQVLGRVVRSGTSLVNDSLATLWIVDGARLVARARAGVRRHSTVAGRSAFALGEGLVGHAALERRTLLVPDVLADPRTVDRAYCAAEGLAACVAIPLVSHGRLVGVLALLARRAGDLGATEVEMLTAFGGHAAIAIASARLYADAERRRREAETLADVARELAQCRDLDTVLARIAQGASALCAADVTSLAVRDADGSFPVRHVIGARSDAYRRFRVVPGVGIGGHAVASGRPGRAAERVAWPPMPPQYAEAIDAEGIRSALAVPIVVGQAVEGLLYVCSRTPRSFSDADETVLVRLADHAAAAIHNNRLFAAEQAARTEAQTSAQDFRDLVDTLDAIVIDADAETFRIAFVNRRAEAILGYSRHEWYADPDFWVHHVHPDDREWAAALCRNATAEGRDHVMQYRMLAADGRVVWVHDMVRVLPGRADGRRQLRSVMVDVTERKQAELEIQRHRQLLAHLTRVATLGELSGALAHELSQPLTSILSNAQAAQRLMAREPVDLREVRDILTDIVDEDRRAGEVIRRWRTLLRKGETQLQPLDVNDVTNEVLRLAHGELIAHGVTVSARLTPGLPAVHGDRVGLQQVLLNLIVNACDAMTLNEPAQRQLAVVTAPDGEGAVQVSIADRGGGIPADGIERVFEPFFTTKAQGLGLGLAICRSIIAAHGGRLWATNNVDRGATFRFVLPGPSGGGAA